MIKAFKDIMIEGAGINVLLCAYIITSLLVGAITILYFGICAYERWKFVKHEEEEHQKILERIYEDEKQKIKL